MKHLALIPLLALTGCLMRVPATRVSFNPATHEVLVKSPKDVELTNLTATVDTNGSAVIKIEKYSSKNNSEVIAAVARQNAEMMREAANLIKNLAEVAGAFTGEAAKQAVK